MCKTAMWFQFLVIYGLANGCMLMLPEKVGGRVCVGPFYHFVKKKVRLRSVMTSDQQDDFDVEGKLGVSGHKLVSPVLKYCNG